MEENKDVILCPGCGVENPKSRVTCEICHAKLYVKKPKQKEVESLNPFTENPAIEKPPEPEKKPRKKRQPKIKKESSGNPKDESPAPSKRKRHKKVKSQFIEYFALARNGLLPVSINIQVKPLKKKQISIKGQNLISLWNRNKSLLK